MRNLSTVLHKGCTNFHSYQPCKSVPISPYSCCFFDLGNNHPKRHEVIAHCGFDLDTPEDQRCAESLHRPVGRLGVLFEEMSV